MSEQIEATVDAMINKLQTNLKTTIDTMNGSITDGIGIPYAEGITFGTSSDHPYPWIMLMPQGTTSADASGRIYWNHKIRVVSWLQDYQEDHLVRLLIRFQRAVRETIMPSRTPGLTFGDGGYGLQHSNDEYGPVFQTEGETGYFYSWVSTVFMVQDDQILG